MGGPLSVVVLAGADAFEFLLVPGLAGHLTLQVGLEAEVTEALRLVDTPVVVRYGPFFRRPDLLQHLPRLDDVRHRPGRRGRFPPSAPSSAGMVRTRLCPESLRLALSAALHRLFPPPESASGVDSVKNPPAP